MEQGWAALRGSVDEDRHAAVAAKLRERAWPAHVEVTGTKSSPSDVVTAMDAAAETLLLMPDLLGYWLRFLRGLLSFRG